MLFDTKVTDIAVESGQITGLMVSQAGERLCIAVPEGHTCAGTQRQRYFQNVGGKRRRHGAETVFYRGEDRTSSGCHRHGAIRPAGQELGLPPAEYKVSYRCKDAEGSEISIGGKRRLQLLHVRAAR